MKHLLWWKCGTVGDGALLEEVGHQRRTWAGQGQGSGGFMAMPYFLTTDIEWPAASHPWCHAFPHHKGLQTPSCLKPWVKPFLNLVSYPSDKRSDGHFTQRRVLDELRKASPCLIFLYKSTNSCIFQYACFNLPGPFHLKLFPVTLLLGKSPPRVRLSFSFQDPFLHLKHRALS